MEFLSSLFTGTNLALLGVAFSVGFAGSGSAKGVGIAGEAAAGLLAVQPEHFGRCLILQAIPGTQGIYGLIVSFLILFAPGVLEGTVPLLHGFGYFCAALPTAIAGYHSAIAQGRTAAAGIGIIAVKPEEFMKGVLAAGLVETYAVLALLISVLVYLNVPTIAI